MEFVRKSPRGTLNSAVMLTVAGSDTRFGQVIDISLHGAALTVDGRLEPGMAVTLLLDPQATTQAHERGLPSFPAVVTWARRDLTTAERPGWRVGVSFDELPHEVRTRLPMLVPSLARGTGSFTCPIFSAPTPEDLAQTPAGREALFQQALTCLARRDYAGTRTLARHALAVVPHARHLRALVCRASAEEALDLGKPEIARREAAFALRLSPEDATLRALVQRTAPPPAAARGVLMRLFGG